MKVRKVHDNCAKGLILSFSIFLVAQEPKKNGMSSSSTVKQNAKELYARGCHSKSNRTIKNAPSP